MDIKNRVQKPNITFENVIRFPRMLAQNIIGYEVKVEEEVRDGVFAKYSLPIIDNPISPNPIIHKDKYDFVNDGVFKLPNETYYSPDYYVKLYINGTLKQSLYITFNENTKLLKVNLSKVPIDINDIIEIEHYRDEVEIKHSTTNKCLYYVEPVLDKSYLIGDHNILR